MNKGYSSRKEGNRKPERKIIIVCEGKKTEINYFNGFKIRGSGVEIIPLHGKCTDPMNIISYAEEKMYHKWSIDLDEGDEVWCAFDVDENSNSTIKDACTHAKTKNIQVALSNPSFELWFLLHFKEVFSPISRQDVIKELKLYIPHYEKNQKINHQLSDNLAHALVRARKLKNKHEKENIELLSKDSNPSTQVFALIECIQQI
jgi:hypothetical protein